MFGDSTAMSLDEAIEMMKKDDRFKYNTHHSEDHLNPLLSVHDLEQGDDDHSFTSLCSSSLV
jgi:hypothetical protein